MADETLRNLALSNALSSLVRERRLPQKVFAGQWEDYLFFESDFMFEEDFMNVANVLFRDEQASVIALINLSFAEMPEPFFLERETSWTDYHTRLVGDGTPINWVFLRDRYVCASDKGKWVIYCERQNDVAIFAYRRLSGSIVANIQQLLRATSVESTTSLVSAEGFNFGKLVLKWRNTLKAELVPSRPS